MRHIYDLAGLLFRRMTDYGYRSVDELAEAAGLEPSTIFHLLKHERMCPRPETRRKLCRVLDIDPDVFNKAVVNGWTVGAEE